MPAKKLIHHLAPGRPPNDMLALYIWVAAGAHFSRISINEFCNQFELQAVCVSRYFAPAKGIPEDPVTGGAHCALAPYWAERLGKTDIHAFQASARGGALHCRLRDDRVELEGSCVFYLEGIAQW